MGAVNFPVLLDQQLPWFRSAVLWVMKKGFDGLLFPDIVASPPEIPLTLNAGLAGVRTRPDESMVSALVLPVLL